jgi:predicted metal-binding membrane protein
MTAVAYVARRVGPPEILAFIAAAWVLAVVAQQAGASGTVRHGELIEGRLPLWVALAVFLLAWQAMIAAMMLPSSLPFIRLFGRASSGQPRSGMAMAAFLGGYAAVWTWFGASAFLGDIVIHELVHRSSWLEQRTWIIAGGVLALAGAFQFSSLKNACLRECRNPAAYLLRHYRRGVREAFRIGYGHGLYCLGCCWALMLLGFAVGVASLPWMALLTLVMVFEKTGRGGDRGVRPIGVALLTLAALVLVFPGAAPMLGFEPG